MSQDKTTLQRYDPGETENTENNEPIVHSLGVDHPLAFEVMNALRAAGLKILDPQSGREYHALINIPSFGLTREIKNHDGRTFGLVPDHIFPKENLQITDILIDKKEPPYDIEAILYLHGNANWAVAANADIQWVLVVCDAINIKAYIELILPVVQNFPVDLLVTPLIKSFEKDVRIKPASIIPSGPGLSTTAEEE